METPLYIGCIFTAILGETMRGCWDMNRPISLLV